MEHNSCNGNSQEIIIAVLVYPLFRQLKASSKELCILQINISVLRSLKGLVSCQLVRRKKTTHHR